MGGGNGAKSAKAREKAAKEAKGSAGSQLKSNAAAMSIQCVICKSAFQSTSKAPQLTEHATNKHNKTLADCFPTFKA